MMIVEFRMECLKVHALLLLFRRNTCTCKTTGDLINVTTSFRAYNTARWGK